MGFANTTTLEMGAYDADKDFQGASGHPDFVIVPPGAFTIFYPEDAHMPGLCVDVPQPVRKVVIKVKLDS